MEQENHVSNYATSKLLFPWTVKSNAFWHSHGTYTAAAAPGASVMGSSYKSFYLGRKSLKWDAFPIW